MLRPEGQLPLPYYTTASQLAEDGLTGTQAQKALEACGWAYKGSGAACTVYVAPSNDKVIKIVGYDPGQRATLAAAQAHPDNPHLPKVFDVAELSDGDLAAEVELLNGYPREFNEWSKTYSPPRRARASETSLDALPEGPMKDALKALQDAAREADEVNGGVTIWDTHDGNVMKRPGTDELVLNDLLYDRGYSGPDSGYCGSDCSCCSNTRESEE